MQQSRLGSTASQRHVTMVLIVCLLVSAPGFTFAPQAQMRDTAIVVDTLDDELDEGGGDCSLREAIQAANTDSAVDGCPAGSGDDDAILLPAGTYILTRAGADEEANSTGDLDVITGTLIVMGPGPERVVVDGSRLDRVLHIHTHAAVEIHGVQITGGKTPYADSPDQRAWGGAIYNDGQLLLAHSTITGNSTTEGAGYTAVGGHGGAIYNHGVLTLDHVMVVGNVAGVGGASGGSGGGIYNDGALTLLNTTIVGNNAGDGASLVGSYGGDGGSGGGLFNTGSVELAYSTIESNHAGEGGIGWNWGGTGGLGGGIYSSGVLTMSASVVVSNVCGSGGDTWAGGYTGPGGGGGGLYSTGTAVVTGTLVAGNHTGRGGGGDHGSSGGAGGGIHNAGDLRLSGSSVQDNATGGGGFSLFYPYVNHGGPGGGIYNSGSIIVRHSTIHSNTTGPGGTSFQPISSRGGHGGGICNEGTLLAVDSTISTNTTGDGSRGDLAQAGSGGGLANFSDLTLESCTIGANAAGTLVVNGTGGGVYTQAPLHIRNTIVSGNSDVTGPSDCHDEGGSLISLGYNLVQFAGSCVLAATGDLTLVEPQLAPLGDHGGATLTQALLPGSPAIDQGSCRGSAADQRGFPRPRDHPHVANADDGCDIGAFEYQATFYLYLPHTAASAVVDYRLTTSGR